MTRDFHVEEGVICNPSCKHMNSNCIIVGFVINYMCNGAIFMQCNKA